MWCKICIPKYYCFSSASNRTYTFRRVPPLGSRHEDFAKAMVLHLISYDSRCLSRAS